MLNITLLTSVAKSVVGAVATKLVDTFISTKINTKIEQNNMVKKYKIRTILKINRTYITW